MFLTILWGAIKIHISQLLLMNLFEANGILAEGGQAQEDLLKKFRTAYNFYKKWDVFHLKQLTQEQYDEMRKDLYVLEQKYNTLLLEMEDGIQLEPDHFSFYQLVEFSKQTPKK